MTVRDRIREFRRVPASSLRPNPRNWRKHPSKQKRILSNVLEQIGFADALLVRECDDGVLELIDGHLRLETTPDQELPVLVLDVDEREANQLLLSHDPLTALAETDVAQLNDLLAEADLDTADLRILFSEFDFSEPAPDQTDQLSEAYEILIKCENEAAQAELLQHLTAEGYECRALIA